MRYYEDSFLFSVFTFKILLKLQPTPVWDWITRIGVDWLKLQAVTTILLIRNFRTNWLLFYIHIWICRLRLQPYYYSSHNENEACEWNAFNMSTHATLIRILLVINSRYEKHSIFDYSVYGIFFCELWITYLWASIYYFRNKFGTSIIFTSRVNFQDK